jgi:hypothetical protein
VTASGRLLAVVVFVAAAAVGVLLTSLLTGGGGGSAPVSPSPIARASSSPTAAPASSSPPASEVPTPSPEATSAPASESATPPAATEKPTVAPGVPSAISFSALKLDAADDPAGKNRAITFDAVGAGTVSAVLSSVSPRGETKMCLRSTSKDFGCTTTASGSISAPTAAKRRTFTLTLRGAGAAAPQVDLALTFPSADPSVTMAHARFDGTGSPDTNGIDATFTPHADGKAHIVAEWGGHPFLYELTLKAQGGPGAHVVSPEEPATGVDTRLGVTAPNPWRLVLANAEEGFGATPMTVTIGWP